MQERAGVDIKHLMTGPKGNSEFCWPETLNVPKAKPRETLFPAGPVIKCFVIPPDSKLKKPRRNRLLHAGGIINLLQFQET